MHISDITRRALRNLWQARTRTILTALAIGIGAFSLAVTIALGTSLDILTKRLITRDAAANELQVQVFQADSGFGEAPSEKPKEFDPNKRVGEQGSFGPPPTLKQADLTDIDAVEGVARIDRRAEFTVPLRYLTTGGKKYETSYLLRFVDEKPALVAPTELEDLTTGTVAIQEQFLSELGYASAEEALGKPVTLGLELPDGTFTEQAFTIGAVAQRPNGIFSVFTAGSVHVNQTDGDRLYDLVAKGTADYNQFYGVTVILDEGADADTVKDRIAALGEGKRFQVSNPSEIGDDASSVIRTIQLVLGGFAAIVLFAALFGVVNTQLMSVFQRTREIGLMKALGMPSTAVSRLFLIEAALIGVAGGLVGTLTAWGASLALDGPARKLVSDIIQVDKAIYFNWAQILIMVLALGVIAALAGLLPARRAAKLDPIEALRTE